MPVPSSYNDITTDETIRDFVGWVWYDRNFFVSPDWMKKRIVLRFDSAHYNTIVVSHLKYNITFIEKLISIKL